MDRDKKLEEIAEKVGTLHKEFAEALREGEYTEVKDEEPHPDDLLPVDTALMKKCITEAGSILLERAAATLDDAPVDIEIPQIPLRLVYQTAHALFIGALLDNLIAAVDDLRNAVDINARELNEVQSTWTDRR